MSLRIVGESEETALPAEAVDLLVARLCHDVAGPAGAIVNGVELAAEMGPEALTDTLDLLDQSSRKLVDRMAAFRFAYAGRVAAGPDGTPSAALGEVVGLAAAGLAHGRVTLDWPRELAQAPLAAPLARLLLVALLAAEDLIQGRGELALAARPAAGGSLVGLDLAIAGGRVEWTADRAATLYGTAPPGSLTARAVHLYMLGALARRFGLRLTVAPGDQRVALHLGV